MIKSIKKGVCAPTVCDFTLEGTDLDLKKIANFKHKYNAKLIKLTGFIRILLARSERTSAKVADYSGVITVHFCFPVNVYICK
jgi:hypothetical protein